MNEDLREKVFRIARSIATGEHVAGLEDEKEIERILSVLEKYESNLSIRRIRFPMISWRLLEAQVEPRGSLYIAPYVEDFDVESKLFFLNGDPSDPATWRSFPEGRVAVAQEPENPDEVKAAALLAAEAGAQGLLIYSRSFSPRKIVTNGSWGYSFHLGSPTPIPVAYINKELLDRLRRTESVRIYIKAETVRTFGTILEVDSGWEPGRPVFGAHYDRWFNGFQDDSLGVAQAFIAWMEAVKRFGGGRLLLLSAEEHGALGYAGWYWAWGSRWYAKQLDRAGLSEHLGPYVNFDVAGAEPLMISGSPQLVCNIVGHEIRERCCECPECDSFSFAMIGLETLSFHSLWSQRIREIYHTPLDSEENFNLDTAVRAVVLSIKALEKGENWGCFEERLPYWLGGGGILSRRAYYIIESMAKRVGWGRVYRELSRRFLKAVNYGDYRWSSGDLEAVWFPEVVMFRRILDDLEKGKRPPLEVWISGEERLLYTFWVPRGGRRSKEMIVEQAYENIKLLNDLIEEVKKELIA